MSIRRSGTGRVFVWVCLTALSIIFASCSHDDELDAGHAWIPPSENDSNNMTDFRQDMDLSCDFAEMEWQEMIPSTDSTPDLMDARVRLYIPCSAEQISGVMIFSHIGVGEWEYDHEMWRASARKNGYALMMIELGDIHGRVAPWEFPEQSARFVTRILSLMGEHSEHGELETCPLFFFGHSAGGFWFTRMMPKLYDRTGGFLAFHGALTSEALFTPDAILVPGLFLVAEYDPIWIRNDTTEIVAQGRKNGANWALVLEPGAGHWDVDPGRRMMIDFTETIFQLRVGQNRKNQATPLLDPPTNNSWLGQLNHEGVFDGDEKFEGSGKEIVISASISPWNETNSNTGHWLVSESFAQSWLSYELYGIY